MDEKGNALGPTSRVKVITHADNKSSFCPTTTNREWVSMIEVISGDRKKGPICVMFKGSDIKPIWMELIKNIEGEAQRWGGIEMTGKGWTINEVGLSRLKTKFTPWAKNRLQRTHILLIVDGHGSHVSLEFIDFCIKNQIVALCLSPHTTHILQPLNVGILGHIQDID